MNLFNAKFIQKFAKQKLGQLMPHANQPLDNSNHSQSSYFRCVLHTMIINDKGIVYSSANPKHINTVKHICSIPHPSPSLG